MVEFLRDHEAVAGEVLGPLGFSAGAWWVFLLSTLMPEHVRAVVAFYGTAPIEYSAARAAYVGHYAEDDEWEPEEEVRGTEAALRTAGREVTFHTYPGVAHWFFEEDRPRYYDAEAARLAWGRTVDFLRARSGRAG